MSLLDKIIAVNSDRMSIHEGVELLTLGNLLVTTYAQLQVPTPDRLKEALAAIQQDVLTKRRDLLVARQRELQSRRSTLRTREELRSDIDAELAELDKRLAQP